MIATIFSSALQGVEAFRVLVEVSSNGKGLDIHITGLPDDAIRESLGRIDTAIQACGFWMPRTKLVINLVPADTRKMGTAYDLPIALGILIASGQLHDFGKLADYTIVGELGLDGSIHSVRGALCMAVQSLRDGYRGILVPSACAQEAAMVKGIHVFSIAHLKDVLEFIKADIALEPSLPVELALPAILPGQDFNEVKGQASLKRALEIAAAGGHNTLIMGPPGIGKTMLVKRMPGILPPMSTEEALQTARIYSVVQPSHLQKQNPRLRPFRSPHHTISDVGLAGGGSIPIPGEVSLAHNGILFLDELPEFKRSVIEVLPQPLEERKLTITRAKISLEFPAAFMLVASMNACPCGYYGHPESSCHCSTRAIKAYRKKISGPVLDRIDLQVAATPVSLHEMLNEDRAGDSSFTIRTRVIKARQLQAQRLCQIPGLYCNAQMPDHLLADYCILEEHARRLLIKRMEEAGFSMRSYGRILKLSRTIADLAGTEQIELPHIAEALHFRQLDKPLLHLSDKKIVKMPVVYNTSTGIV